MQPYSYAEWKIAGVNIDYHIEIKSHYYSVPHQLIGKKIDVRIADPDRRAVVAQEPDGADDPPDDPRDEEEEDERDPSSAMRRRA